MVNRFTCPHCGVLAQMNTLTNAFDSEDTQRYDVFKCVNCTGLVFRCYEITLEDREWVDGDLIHQYPSSLINIHDSVPDDVSKLYGQGVRCINTNAPDGAMTCFRKCLQKICLNKGANPKHDLWQQVDTTLHDRAKKLSTEIREWGNIGAHPDNNVPDPTLDQAIQVKEFLDIIFIDEFELPAKIEASRKQRGKS